MRGGAPPARLPTLGTVAQGPPCCGVSGRRQVRDSAGRACRTLGTVIVSPGVDPPVLGQTGAVPEGPAALTTLVGLLASVRPLVPDEASDVPEQLLALVAAVGLLACVRPLVPDEVRLSMKAFPALCALEGLLPGVDLLMHCEVGVAVEGLPALCALRSFSPCESSHAG